MEIVGTLEIDLNRDVIWFHTTDKRLQIPTGLRISKIPPKYLHECIKHRTLIDLTAMTPVTEHTTFTELSCKVLQLLPLAMLRVDKNKQLVVYTGYRKTPGHDRLTYSEE